MVVVVVVVMLFLWKLLERLACMNERLGKSWKYKQKSPTVAKSEFQKRFEDLKNCWHNFIISYEV